MFTTLESNLEKVALNYVIKHPKSERTSSLMTTVSPNHIFARCCRDFLIYQPDRTFTGQFGAP